MKPQLEKYLRRNPVSHKTEPAPERPFRHAIVIPAYAESEYLPSTLECISRNPVEFLKDTMVLAVINNHPSSVPDKINDNQKILSSLRADSFGFQKNMNLFWIDASSEGLELSAEGGVGAARKLGMDTALRHLEMDSDALIFCLDADTRVTENYIEAAVKSFNDNKNAPGGVFSFEHQPGKSDAENSAITDYELFMRYYLAGLSFAKSPYAYHALGSAIACRAEAYVKAGGMREKNGGEDFYFLQALRKLGPIIQITGACVYPSSRPSDRVPFGTGPKIRDIMNGKKIHLCNPLIFSVMKKALAAVSEAKPEDFSAFVPFCEKNMPADFILFLDTCAFSENWEKIYRNTPADLNKLREAFNIWFDAFRTLKFVHFCERHAPDKYPAHEIIPAFAELFGNNGMKLDKSVLSSHKTLLDWLRKNNF